MNVFRFLDETIRGAILFVFGFVGVTFTLIRHPLVGPLRIYRLSRSGDAEQLSSLTYLALCMLLTISFVRVGASGDWGAIPQSVLHTTTQMFGGQTGSLTSVVVGALAGTMLIAGALRLMAPITKLRGRKKGRFLSGSEYACGFSVLMLILLVSLLELSWWAESEWKVSALIAQNVLSIVFTIIYMTSGVLIVAQFWVGLTRDPRLLRAARDYHRLFLIGKKHGWKKFISARKEIEGKILGYAPGEQVRLISYWVRSATWGLRLSLIMIAPAIVTGGSLLAGAYLAELASSREEPLQILAVNCDVSSSNPTAAAAIWNKSPDAEADWLGLLRLNGLILDRTSGELRRMRLDWAPSIEGGRTTDFLAPGEYVEVKGGVEIPRDAGALVDDSCSIELSDPLAEMLDLILEAE